MPTPEMTQVEMRFDGSMRSIEDAWQILLKIIRYVVDERGLKEVAYELDVSPSHLSHCLNERERHAVPARWIPYFVLRARSDDLVRFLAMMRGLKVAPKKQLTPEQKLQRLERVMSEELGPTTRAALLRRAFDEP